MDTRGWSIPSSAYGWLPQLPPNLLLPTEKLVLRSSLSKRWRQRKIWLYGGVLRFFVGSACRCVI